MRYWDSSALVALLLPQEATAAVRDLYATDPVVVTWMFSDVEFRSAVARLVREGLLAPKDANEALSEFDALWAGVRPVSVVDAVKTRARRLLGVHPLRAAVALQLGAALTAFLDAPLGQKFVSLDFRLNDAARREGFDILP